MKTKTLTTLGELREGDRFTYLKRLDVWQVMTVLPRGKFEVNQVDPVTKRQRFKYHDVKSANTQVVFLRHTRPKPQEECFIEDLKPGDVFFKPDDVVTEYVLLGKLKEPADMYGLRKLHDKEGKDLMMTKGLTTVVFVRRGGKA